MKFKSLALFSIVLFLICSFVVNAQELSILAIDGSVFYNDGATLVPNGWNVDVTNNTQGLSLPSTTGDAGDGRYSVTFIDILGGIIAATGDEIEIVITDADGNMVTIDGQESLIYILTDEDVDAQSTTIDVVTDVSAPPASSSVFAIEGTVFLKDGVELAPDGLTVDVTNNTQDLSQSSTTGDAGPGRYSVTFITFDPAAIVAATGDEIEITVTDTAGNKRASIIHQLATVEVLENRTIVDVVLDVTSSLTVNGTVYSEDGLTPVPEGLTVQVTNPSRDLEVNATTTTEGKYSATLETTAPGEYVAVVDEEIVVTVADEEGNSIGSATHILTTAEVVGNEVTIDVNTTYVLFVSFTRILAPGLNMISVPLINPEATVNGSEPVTIGTIGDLKTLLGEDTSVYHYNTGEGKYEEAPVEMEITGDLGLVVMLLEETTIAFEGKGWPGEINLVPGLNMFAVPLDSPQTQTVGDLKTLLSEDVPVYYYDVNEGKFKEIVEDTMAIEGGLGYVTMLIEATTLSIDGEPWENEGVPPAPPAPFAGRTFDPTSTPLMEVKGTVINENTGTVFNGLSVTVRHLDSGAVITDTTGSNINGQFSAVFLNVFNNQSFRVGDVFKIDIHSSNDDIGFEPIQYTVTQDDIKLGRINLGDLTVMSIPKRSKLMQNWPNPFNPETWIPFQLSKAADVTVTIYDIHGRVVRQFELGHTPAGIYNKKSSAIYWNGTNDTGERVSTGVYFYHIQAGEFSASRKMVILK